MNNAHDPWTHRLLVLAAAIWAVALVTLSSRAADAHSISIYYAAFWNSADLPQIGFKFDAEFPNISGNKRDRVNDAAFTWNAVTNANIDLFQSGGADYATYPSSPACNQPEDKNGIHFENLVGSYGVTRQCIDTVPNPDKIFNAQLVLDSDLPTGSWYSGTGNTPADQVDVEHIVAHEFGHFNGWGAHFGSEAQCPVAGPFSAWETMCNSVDLLTDDTEYGRNFRRSLDTHDIDTFQAAY